MPVCLNPEKEKHEEVSANYKQVSFKSDCPGSPDLTVAGAVGIV